MHLFLQEALLNTFLLRFVLQVCTHVPWPVFLFGPVSHLWARWCVQEVNFLLTHTGRKLLFPLWLFDPGDYRKHFPNLEHKVQNCYTIQHTFSPGIVLTLPHWENLSVHIELHFRKACRVYPFSNLKDDDDDDSIQTDPAGMTVPSWRGWSSRGMKSSLRDSDTPPTAELSGRHKDTSIQIHPWWQLVLHTNKMKIFGIL